MRIIVEIARYSAVLSFILNWTKWYLPIHVWKMNYLTSREVTVSILWFIHFSIRFPTKVNPDIAQNYLPPTARRKKV